MNKIWRKQLYTSDKPHWVDIGTKEYLHILFDVIYLGSDSILDIKEQKISLNDLKAIRAIFNTKQHFVVMVRTRVK